MLSLVSSHRAINNDGANPVKKLGKRPRSAEYSPFSFRQIFEFILFLPLNFIPVVGTPLFLILTGYRAGPLHHWRYFKLHELTRKERNAEIQSRRWKYTWYGTRQLIMIIRAHSPHHRANNACRFGTTALLLQLVPVAQMFFLLTTATGSALWAAKLEQQRTLLEGDGVGRVHAEHGQSLSADDPV